MTKEEIMKADIKDLGLRYIQLVYSEIILCTKSYDLLFVDTGWLSYKRLCKINKTLMDSYHKESNLILKLRPGVKSYIKFILERVKFSSKEIIVTPYPGIYLKEIMFENDIFAEDLADDLGISEDELFLILNGKSKITEELANKLSEVTETSAEVWINLQKSYDESNKLIKE